MIEVGPFALHERLGSGATGDVWRAEHGPQRVSVALKVIRAHLAQDDHTRQLLRNEVQALAQLSHPGIITLLDVGTIEPATAAASKGELVAGSPYIAMDLADSTLLDWAPRLLRFEALRQCLLQLLDALAHAHARGVIHRDLKPMNVLTSTRDGALRLMLADFGVAHALRARSSAPQALATTISGTPPYMAPEQVRGEHREQGPWTDLYALGCLAFWLTSGRTPFFGETGHVLWSHVRGEVPPLRALFEVPVGYESWLRHLLAKRPADRYRFAADAAYGLMALPTPSAPAPSAQGHSANRASTPGPSGQDYSANRASAPGPAAPNPAVHEAAAHDMLAPGGHTTVVFSDATWPAAPPRPAGDRPVPAPIAHSWRQNEPPSFSPQLLGAGISLFHLRPIPLHGRETERDVLWQQLIAVAERSVPAAVVVRGESGVGKSALARWLSERAHELGGAEVMRVTHAPINGPHDGMAATITHFARIEDLPREETLQRLAQLTGLTAEQAAQCGELQLLADLTGGDGEELGKTGAHRIDGQAAMVWLVCMLARQRPLLLCIEDAQWSKEDIELCQQLLRHTDTPLFMVLTVRDDELQNDAAAQTALAALVQHPGVTQMQLAPLEPAHHHALIMRMLPLEARLAASVAARSEGNPLFAAALLSNWIERGVLACGEQGWALSSADITLPDSIHAVWLARLNRLDDTLKQQSTAALEVAAILGQQVDEAEWHAICLDAGVHVPAQLVEHLVYLRLARRPPPITSGHWAFVHGMLRESIERAAAEAQRASHWHRVCASVLSRRGAASERVARHLLRAGADREALEPLLQAAEACSRRGDFELATYFDDLRDQALDRLGVAQHDKARMRGWLRRARTACLRGDTEQGRHLLMRSKSAAAKSADAATHAELYWVEANLARHDNDFDNGIAMARKSLHHYQLLGDRVGVARCHKKLGELLRITGAIRSAIEHYRRAQRTFIELGDHFELAWTTSGLSSCERQQGHLDEARTHASDALLAFLRVGSRLGVGHAHNELGEAARLAGRFDAAQAHYAKVIEAWQHDEHRDLALIRFNMAMAVLGAGDAEGAEQLLTDILEGALLKGRRALQSYCLAGLCASCSKRRQWRAAQRYARELAECLAAIDLVDVDIAQALTQGAQAAAEAGEAALRDQFIEMALPQWQTLGDSQAAETLQALR